MFTDDLRNVAYAVSDIRLCEWACSTDRKTASTGGNRGTVTVLALVDINRLVAIKDVRLIG